MKLVICLDENNGINFNKRRQSQDIKQREDFVKLIGKEKLFLKEYSFELYKDFDLNLEIVKDFYEKEGYYLFEEKVSDEFLEKVDTIICYFWNRDYPFDETFEAYQNKEWKEFEKKEFVGKSHDKITRIIYKK